MLYRVLILLLTVAFMLTSCDDENDSPKQTIPNPPTVVTITGPEFVSVMYCGPDFWTKADYTIHVTDTSEYPLSGISVKFLPNGWFSPVVPADTLLETDSNGDAFLEVKTQSFGGPILISVVVFDDTTSFVVSLQFSESIFGSYIRPISDTLYDRPELPDSMEIRAQLFGDWGLPSSTDSTRFSASSGFIDTTYHGYEEGVLISVYWYPTEEVQPGRITIYGETKTYCGQYPDNYVTILILDSTSFIFFPTP
ncbi:MAG: hypothetical protein IPP40_09470 [bacterium]|nr:hypothetical protein [bacterium]